MKIYNHQFDINTLNFNDSIIIGTLVNYYFYILDDIDRDIEYNLKHYELTGDHMSYFNICIYHCNKNNFEKSEEYFKKYYDIQPDIGCIYTFVNLLENGRQYDRMILYLDTILKLENIKEKYIIGVYLKYFNYHIFANNVELSIY